MSPPGVIRQRFSVAFEYPVVFADDVFAPGSAVLSEIFAPAGAPRAGGASRALVVLDGGLVTAWPELPARVQAWFAAAGGLALAAAPVVLPGGEAAKNAPAILDRLHASFHELRLDRHAFVVVIGGGAVQDAAGYAAATAHRGIRTVRLPTTVLGQNDSGVGVKNGVNAFATKNFLGTFSPPFAVVNDGRFLDFLPRRERVAGMAEALKVAIIRDAAFFAWLEAQAPALAAGERGALRVLIRRAAELHLGHIATSGDPFERGSARPLDFGHWAAHKLESLTAHELRHGEAVGLGMLLDFRYAAEAGLTDEASLLRVEALMRAVGLPRWHAALDRRAPDGTPAVFAGIEEFREHLGGALTVTMPRGLGAAVEVHELDRARLERALAWMRGRA